MKKIILILLVALNSFACIKQDDINIYGVEKVNISSNSRVELGLKIENNSPSKVTIKDLNLGVKLKGNDILKLTLVDNIIVARRSKGVVDANFAYKFSNPLALLPLMGKNANYDKLLKDITLTGAIELKASMINKKFKFENNSLSEVLKSTGLDPKELIKSLKL